MTDGERDITRRLLEEYEIESAQNIRDVLRDLLGSTIKKMMESEMDEHLDYYKPECSDCDGCRSGCKAEQVNSGYGGVKVGVPQSHNPTFGPQVAKKHQKDISDIGQKIISMYTRRVITRRISETLENIYGFGASKGSISDIVGKPLPQIEDWRNRPLSDVYPVLHIDVIRYSVRGNGATRKLAICAVLGINSDGLKEVLTIGVGKDGRAEYWLSVLSGLKNRGVKDILLLCADGLTGIKEAITAAFLKTEYQRCIVHQIRDTLKYISGKDRRLLATDLKTIYWVPTGEKILGTLEWDTGKWSEKYPNSIES